MTASKPDRWPWAPEAWRWTEEPFALDISAYDRATAELVEQWTSLDRAPMAIFQIGEVGVPGVSDLDFVVVYEDLAPIPWPNFTPEAQSPEMRRIFTHPPYVCSLDSWTRLQSWLPTFNLKHLAGARLDTPTLAAELEPGVALGCLTDYLLVKVPADLLTELTSPLVRVRIALGILNSWKYVLRMAATAGIVEIDGLAIREAVNALRCDWLTLGDDERRRQLHDVVEHVLVEDDQLTAALQDALGGMAGGTGHIDTWTLQLAAGKSFSLADNLQRRASGGEWMAPPALFGVLAVYGEVWPELGDYLLGRMRPSAGSLLDSRFGPGLVEHALGMRSIAEGSLLMGVPPQKYIALGFIDSGARRRRMWDFARRVGAGQVRPSQLGQIMRREFRRFRGR